MSVSILTVLAPTGLPDGTHLMVTQTICEKCTTLLASQIMGEVTQVNGRWLRVVRGPDGKPMPLPQAEADPAADLGDSRNPLWHP